MVFPEKTGWTSKTRIQSIRQAGFMVFENVDDFDRWMLDKNIGELKRNFRIPEERNSPPDARRSALMVSGARARHLNKLDSLEADIAMINLEDGIAPEEKESARSLTAAFLSGVVRRKSLLVVRINPLEEGGREDLEAILPARPDAIRLPKVRHPAELEELLKLVPESIRIHVSIETREAFGAIRDFALEDRVDTFYLGILDLLISLGVPQSILEIENPLILDILTRFFLETRIAGRRPVSFVYQKYRDREVFRKWLELVRSIGYRSTGCIAPGQVKMAHEVFAPTEQELKDASRIVERFQAKAKEGITGFSDDLYGFIDEPIYRDALSVLESALPVETNHPESVEEITGKVEENSPVRKIFRPEPLY